MKRLVSILLVQPENPDNIGASARAMKNMGFTDLRLVRPHEDWKIKGKKMAVSADDVLERARVFSSTQEAVHDAALVLGTTRRTRRHSANVISFKDAVDKIISHADQGKKTAIMFGKESKGLSNEDLNCCDWVTAIPTAPIYPSINLAQAVMAVSFMLHYQNSSEHQKSEMGPGGDKVSKKEEYEVLESLRAAVATLGYSPKSQLVERISSTFHGMIKREGLLKREAQMLKGLSRRIREKMNENINVCS